MGLARKVKKKYFTEKADDEVAGTMEEHRRRSTGRRWYPGPRESCRDHVGLGEQRLGNKVSC